MNEVAVAHGREEAILLHEVVTHVDAEAQIRAHRELEAAAEVGDRIGVVSERLAIDRHHAAAGVGERNDVRERELHDRSAAAVQIVAVSESGVCAGMTPPSTSAPRKLSGKKPTRAADRRGVVDPLIAPRERSFGSRSCRL